VTTAQRARKILAVLKKTHPDAKCALNHRSPLQLLVATILSAQTTDIMVNRITPVLFQRYPTPQALADARARDVERIIKPTGFFRQKTKAITHMSRSLLERFGGRVPLTMEDLITLEGVGRKTANVVLNTAFGEPTIAVDTHIFRVANRTGIAPGKDVETVEQKLMKLVPEEFRHDAHHWLILHGRYTCIARTPQCWNCMIADLCEYKAKMPMPLKAV